MKGQSRALVVFQKWRGPCLHGPSAGRAVDTQAQDDGLPRGRWRTAAGRAGQACEARPAGQRLARAWRRGAGAGAGLGGSEVPRVGAPRLARRARQPAGRQQRGAPPQHGGLAAPAAVGPARAGGGSAGRPEPARVAWRPDTRPPRSPRRLRCPSALQVPGPRGRGQGAPPRGGTASRPPACGVRARRTRWGPRGRERAGSRPPLAWRRLARSVCLPSGTPPRGPESRRQRPLTPRGGLAEGARRAPGCVAALDALVPLTVRVADRDARHGPFLLKRLV